MSRAIRILFVCTANVCRSPMAGGFMVRNAQSLNAPVQVASASVDLQVRAIHPTAQTILAEHGISLGRDQSQPVTRELVSGADLVLAMTGEHVRRLVGRFPEARARIFTLAHLAAIATPRGPDQAVHDWLTLVHGLPRDYARTEQWDIEDPILATEETFRRVGDQIDQATFWLASLVH